MVEKVKVGIASFKQVHARSYMEVLRSLPGVEVVALAEEDPVLRASLAGTAPVVHGDYGALAKDPAVDVVVVTTENAKHAEVAVAALENGKHAIVEKPIATTLEDADAMIRASRQAGRFLAQCFPCRFHPTAAELHRAIRSGELGRILSISGTNHGKMPDSSPGSPYAWFSDPVLAGGGAVMDHTTHLADLVFWFTGAKVKRVQAWTANFYHHDRNVEDAAHLLVTYDDGLTASIDPSWSRPDSFPTWGDLTMMVFGTKESAWLDMFGQNLRVFPAGGRPPSWHNYGDDADLAMMRHFVDCVRRDESPEPTGEDGRRALEVVLLAYESARKGVPVAPK
ncbi:MAG: Gfo/Idh/MocA family oxidoreductase [Promethearchaeota archaeon]